MACSPVLNAIHQLWKSEFTNVFGIRCGQNVFYTVSKDKKPRIRYFEFK